MAASLTPPARLLHTCFSRSWGGLEIHALELPAELCRRGFDVTLACLPGSRLENEAGTHGLRTLPLDVSGYFHPAKLAELSRFLRRNAVQLIHCHLSRDLATVVPAMRLSSLHIPVLLSKSMGSGVMKRDPLHRFTYRHVSRVLAISEVIRRNVLDTTPMPADRVDVFHFFVDTERFDPEKVSREKVRRELGVSGDQLVVGMMGRFSPGKGHEEFLAAASMLRPHHPRLRYVIVGEASYREEEYYRKILARAEEFHLQDVLTFPGFRTDVPDVLSSFDVFAFPSHAESFGMVLIEAMAMERPVVSSNCDGVLDIVVDGETGIMVPPKDPFALAEGIVRLALDETFRHQLGKAGRRRAVASFDKKRQVERLLGIYQEERGRLRTLMRSSKS